MVSILRLQVIIRVERRTNASLLKPAHFSFSKASLALEKFESSFSVAS